MYGPPARAIEKRKEIGGMMFQQNIECPVSNGFKTDFRKIFDFSQVKGFRIFDRQKHVGIFCSESWRQHPLVEKQKVVTDDRIAIGPTGILPQIKRIFELVL